jgi:hypothetical protein
MQSAVSFLTLRPWGNLGLDFLSDAVVPGIKAPTVAHVRLPWLTSHSIVPTMEPTRLVMLACKAGFWSSNTDSSVEPARGRPKMKCCRDPSGNGPDPHGRYLLRDAPHAGAAFERHQEFGMVAGALDTQCFEPLRLQPYLRGDEGVGAAMADTGAVEVGPTLVGQHRGDHLIASKTSIITLRRVRHHPTSGDRPPRLHASLRRHQETRGQFFCHCLFSIPFSLWYLRFRLRLGVVETGLLHFRYGFKMALRLRFH